MDVNEVEGQLAELWRETSSEDEAVVRACSLNLVVACDDERDVERATRLVAGVSETAPGRALVIARKGAAAEADELDVFVSAHCHRGAGGVQVCSEQVTLEVRGEGRELVPGTILRLLVEDMPVYTWWRRPSLDRDGLLRPLRDLSDRLIVNSAGFDAPVEQLGALRKVASETSWTGHPADLTWARLEPWREALASFFDGPVMRSRLEQVTRVTVTASGPSSKDGRTAAGAYLAGWLSSRLGWSRRGGANGWSRADGGPLTLEFRQDHGLPAGEVAEARLETANGDSTTAFVARREGSSELVRLTVESKDACPLPHRIKLPSRDEAALLCGVLQQAERDEIFEAALSDAALM